LVLNQFYYWIHDGTDHCPDAIAKNRPVSVQDFAFLIVGTMGQRQSLDVCTVYERIL